MQRRGVLFLFFALFLGFGLFVHFKNKSELRFDRASGLTEEEEASQYAYSQYYYGNGGANGFPPGHDKGSDFPTVGEETKPKPKATFVMLIKDSVTKAVKAVENMDSVFNRQHGYPITVFYEELEKEQMELLQSVSTGKVNFVKVHLSLPPWLNISDVPTKTPYKKDYIGYRHMCRWYSGLVFREEALKEYDFMWRLDDDAKYLCDVKRDPFRYMRDHSYKYGWIQWFWEDIPTSGETLWPVTQEYAKLKGLDTRLDELETLFGGYDRCHYWNNFEILDLRFFRSQQYLDFFDYLDQASGFYFYRWGDALVRTLAIHLLLEKDDVTRISWISYAHDAHCVRKECSQDYPCNHCPDGLCNFCWSIWERKTADWPWELLPSLKYLLFLPTFLFVYCFYERMLQKGTALVASIRYKNAARKN